MKDLTEFSKLFKVRIPVEEHAEYYFGLLRQSTEYAELDTWIRSFEDMENSLTAPVASFKRQALDKLKGMIGASNAYIRFNNFLIPEVKPVQVLDRNKFKAFISLDIEKANWNVLKFFDTNKELPESWAALCDSLGLPQALGISKSYRQVVFGNLNPKRTARIQRYFTNILVGLLKENWPIVHVSDDEVLLGSTAQLLKEESDRIELFLKEKATELSQLPFRVKPYIEERLEKDIFVRTIFKNEEYKVLSGVPGNVYYLYFKSFILNQVLDERDLLFVLDERQARWDSLPDVIRAQAVKRADIDCPIWLQKLIKQNSI